MKKLSRLESNKVVRQALARGGADLSQVSFSCAGKSINLTGSLVKQGGMEFTAKGIENIVEQLHKVGLHITSDLENWDISESSISKKGGGEQEAPKAQKQAPAQAKNKTS